MKSEAEEIYPNELEKIQWYKEFYGWQRKIQQNLN